MPRRPSLTSIQASIHRLALDDQQQLYEWLGQQFQEGEVAEVTLPLGTLDSRNYEGKTYAAQKRRCNVMSCPCMDGNINDVGHGPYWYMYWREGGKTQSKYVGKRPPWEKKNKKQRDRK